MKATSTASFLEVGFVAGVGAVSDKARLLGEETGRRQTLFTSSGGGAAKMDR
jgi:hypothetical protein